MKRLLYTTMLFLATVPTLFAQQDAMFSQYMFNGLFLNPAYAGSHSYMNITAVTRKQWVNFEGAPFSQFLAFDMPVKTKTMGLGLLLANDHLGVTNQFDFYPNYAYHLETGKGKLSLGIRAGVSYYSSRLSELKVWDVDDEIFQENTTSALLPNFGTGIYYYDEQFYAGLSVPHLLNYDPETNFKIDWQGKPQQVRHYFLTSGYAYQFNETLIIKPSILLKYLSSAPLQADMNLSALINDRIWIGASYRTGDSFVALFQVVLKGLNIGYALDLAITDIRYYASGSHEIMISYNFNKEKGASIPLF